MFLFLICVDFVINLAYVMNHYRSVSSSTFVQVGERQQEVMNAQEGGEGCFPCVFPTSPAMLLTFVSQILEESPSLVALLHVRPPICGCTCASAFCQCI